MPRATLSIHIPPRVWIGDLSGEYPEAEFEILGAFPKGEGGVAVTEVRASDAGEVVVDMDEYDAVTDLDLLNRTANTALVQFETSDPILLFPVREAGAPLELPFTISDGVADWEVTASHERLSSLADQLRQFDIEFEVSSVSRSLESEELLTDTQSRVVTSAVDKGYYDTPRKVTLTELAEDLGIAKSTCSETLHRAEEKIIKQFALGTDNPGGATRLSTE